MDIYDGRPRLIVTPKGDTGRYRSAKCDHEDYRFLVADPIIGITFDDLKAAFTQHLKKKHNGSWPFPLAGTDWVLVRTGMDKDGNPILKRLK